MSGIIVLLQKQDMENIMEAVTIHIYITLVPRD